MHVARIRRNSLRAVTATILVLAGVIAAGRAASAFIFDPSSMPPTNIDEGLTDDERHDRYSAARDEYQRRYVEFISHLDLTGLDLRAIPRDETTGVYEQPHQSLEAAVASADLIAIVEVRTFTPTIYGIDSELDIEHVIKGESSGSPLYHQPSRVEWNADGSLAISEATSAAPLLFPGDRVLLFLKHSGYDNGYVPESFTSVNVLTQGVVSPLEGNPFRESLYGLTEAEAVALLEAAVK